MVALKPKLIRNMSLVVQSPVSGMEMPIPAPIQINTPQQSSFHLQTISSGKIGNLVSQEEDLCIRYWMPVLFGLHDVIMTCDLEVRTRALQYLFDTLKIQGSSFSTTFWEILAKGVLFPIFDVMKQPDGMLNSKFSNKEDLQVWLSTTLIQALRQFVDLFTHYFPAIGFMIANMLSLLKVCILHENEAMARIGSTCIQQLVEKNVDVFNQDNWSELSNFFTELFDETSPTFLFFNFKGEMGQDSEFAFLKKPLGPPPDRKEFQRKISKCVLHLLVVETLEHVLESANDRIYRALPNQQLMQLLECFASSYHLARVFNETMPLRESLFKMGYMKQLPNLLKQETMSVNVYLKYLVKIYVDVDPKRASERAAAEPRLIP
jgi:brefeldin A-inhibited guanine nucleotide-exchange protein